MSLNTHTEHNPDAPWNQEESEPLTEFNEVDFLKSQLKIQTERLNYKIWQLKKLAEFEECIRTFGSLTYEQQTEKNEILNQYLK